MNVYEKLINARSEFLASATIKSGKNMGIGFKYFELEDIVPKATTIFKKLGLVSIVSFDENQAIMQLINCEKPEEQIVFTSPMRTLEANKGMNPVQALGAVESYIRRYLWIACLDISENDAIDADQLPTPATAIAPKPTIEAKREAIKTVLTNTNNQADELQIKGLKEACKRFIDASAGNKSKVEAIMAKTNNFTSITKTECEILIKQINDALKPASIKDEELPF